MPQTLRRGNNEDETGSIEDAIHNRLDELNGIWWNAGTGRSSQDRRDM
jgi:hypothetical protein